MVSNLFLACGYLDFEIIRTTCRTGTKIENVLKMVKVPAYLVDLLFDVIEGAVCHRVVTLVGVAGYLVGELLDPATVIG